MLAHVPAKWIPVRRQEHAPNKDLRARSDSAGTERALKHDPEKWIPVLGKDHAHALAGQAFVPPRARFLRRNAAKNGHGAAIFNAADTGPVVVRSDRAP
jgi:hypothetical protein